MNKKTSKEQVSAEETTVFKEAVRTVTPIKQDKILLRKKPSPRIKPIKPKEHTSLIQLLDYEDQDPVAADDKLFFVRSGLSPKQVQKLRKGQLPIAAKLDLHGYDAESARLELSHFIEFAYKHHQRCIIIVHGKGHSERPILKNRLNNWLRQIDQVLGFSTAIPQHGGAGALYVLLKSALKEFKE